MAARVSSALRPLRSCPSLFRSPSSQPTRRLGSYSRPVATSKPARTASPKTTANRTVAASSKPASSKPATAKVASSSKAASPSEGLDPEKVVLDPQAAIPPAPKATIASSFPHVQEPSPIASALSTSSGGSDQTINWSESYHGLGQAPYSSEAAAILMAPLDPEDVEVKPDGIIYLPEIKYRRILNRAFGPGGWGLAPRGDLIVGEKVVTREYALVAHGRFVAQARGECQYFNDETIPTAGEGCKSNALMRCCKDLGIASELWDPRFIRDFKKKYAKEIWVEHVVNKKKRQIWIRTDCEPAYPYKKS